MTDQRANEILANPDAFDAELIREARNVLAPMQTLEDEYGCDPWDDEHFGKHPASTDGDNF